MTEFLHKLRWLFMRGRRENDLLDEIQFHLEEEAESQQERGASPQQAAYAARRDLGNPTLVREDTRAAWTWGFLEHFIQDVRYAFRGFRQNPAFTVTAALSLALGLGASLAIYTVADNLLLRPLPYANGSRIGMLWEQKGDYLHGIVAPRNYFAWKARTDAFADMAVFTPGHAVLTDKTRTEELSDIAAEPGILNMLGTKPLIGRTFTASDRAPGAPPVILISYRLWQGWFAGDPAVIGRRVQYAGKQQTIAGVLPANFYFLDRGVDIWRPLTITPSTNNRDGRWLDCLALLKPGVSLTRAQAEITQVARQLSIQDPSFSKGWTVQVETLRDALVRQVKLSLLVLLGAVGLLLAVACANVASLLLARYTARQREIALRISLGAGRMRVIRQLLTESLILAFIGGAIGMLVARVAVSALVQLAPKDLTQSIRIATDMRVYLVALALTALTSVLFGLAPALAGSRTDLSLQLQDGGRSHIGSGGNLRAWFVGGEIAISVVLLSGALLFFRTLDKLQNVNPGLRADQVLTLRVSLPEARYSHDEKTVQFFQRTVDQVRALPGVISASGISHLPFNGMHPGTLIQISGEPPARPGEEKSASVRTVLPEYFRTLGIPLLAGRDFTEADNRVTAPLHFIVSRQFVEKFLRDSNPLDKQLKVWMAAKNPFGQIIGVVDDVHDETLEDEPSPTVYYPHAQLPYDQMVILAHTAVDPLSLVVPIRRIVRSVDSTQPIADVRTMEEVIATTFSRQHFSALLLAGFSAASLLLAAIGVYGILAYWVSGRVREIGVRVAVGATPANIRSLVFRSAAGPVIAGVAAGITGALALAGLIRTLLFGIGPHDPVTLVLAPVTLALVALLAAWIPSRRAATLDPACALRAG